MNTLVKIRPCILVGFVLFILSGISNPAHAATKTSTTTGDWNVGTTWVGGVVPAAGDYIVIANGHTVTITTTPLKILGITIQAGGILNSGTYTLWITNTIAGGWPEYISDGTQNSSAGGKIYYDASSANLNFSGTGTINCDIEYDNASYNAQFVSCNLVINGDIYFTQGAFVLGTGILTLNGDVFMNDLNFVNAENASGAIINQTGDLFLNTESWIANNGTWNLSGNLNMGGAQNYFVNSGTVTIGGNLSGSGETRSYFLCYGAYASFGGSVFPAGNDGSLETTHTGLISTVEYNGGANQDIKMSVEGISSGIPSTYSNLILSNSGTKTLTGNLTIIDSLTIKNTAALDVSATSYNINLAGPWINTSTASLIERTGTVTLNGATSQSITASAVAGGETFYNLVINNTSSGVTLNSPATVSYTLTLTDGIVFTDATNFLTLNDNATSDAGSAASFVDGPMKKIGNDAFIFPLGDGTVWARLGISAPATANTAYTARYINTVYGDGDLAGDLITNGSPHHVSSLEYWTLDQGINNDDIQITLFWENASVNKITDCAELTLGHFTGAAWVEEAATTDLGSTCTGTGSGSITTDAVVGTYSPFTFASKYGWTNNPLPIELLSFTANCMPASKENEIPKVILNWSTASELNNAYFTLERSYDLISYQLIGKIDGAGNSESVLNYSFVDSFSNASKETNPTKYYRLKQTDYNGDSETFDLISCLCASGNIMKFEVYPIPASESIAIDFMNFHHQYLTIQVIDIFGRIIKKEDITDFNNNIYTLDISRFNPGRYFLKVNDLTQSENVIFIKQ